MKENELIRLFAKYPGIAARIRRSFAYHYDQIQREIETQELTSERFSTILLNRETK